MDVTANGLGPGGLGPGGLDSVGIPESQKDWDFYLGAPRLNPQTTRPQTNKKNHYLRSCFAFHQQNSLLKELTNISPTGRFSSRWFSLETKARTEMIWQQCTEEALKRRGHVPLEPEKPQRLGSQNKLRLSWNRYATQNENCKWYVIVLDLSSLFGVAWYFDIFCIIFCSFNSEGIFFLCFCEAFDSLVPGQSAQFLPQWRVQRWRLLRCVFY